MLLRHTPNEIAERHALTINPAKTCQPIGAMYAALGIHGCLPHSHGSQGCCAYHRSTLTRHYKEPISAGTSSFTEGASVFGGQANLLQAIDNIFTVYEPEVIAVHTTCLSETIGDDIPQIVDKANKEGKIPGGQIRHPRQHAQLRGLPRDRLRQHGQGHGRICRVHRPKNGRVNIIPGWVEPADMEEIKRLAGAHGREHHPVPGHLRHSERPACPANTRCSPRRRDHQQLKSAGDSIGTLALGEWCSADAARTLDTHNARCPAGSWTCPSG